MAVETWTTPFFAIQCSPYARPADIFSPSSPEPAFVLEVSHPLGFGGTNLLTSRAGLMSNELPILKIAWALVRALLRIFLRYCGFNIRMHILLRRGSWTDGSISLLNRNEKLVSLMNCCEYSYSLRLLIRVPVISRTRIMKSNRSNSLQVFGCCAHQAF